MTTTVTVWSSDIVFKLDIVFVVDSVVVPVEVTVEVKVDEIDRPSVTWTRRNRIPMCMIECIFMYCDEYNILFIKI